MKKGGDRENYAGPDDASPDFMDILCFTALGRQHLFVCMCKTQLVEQLCEPPQENVMA